MGHSLLTQQNKKTKKELRKWASSESEESSFEYLNEYFDESDDKIFKKAFNIDKSSFLSYDSSLAKDREYFREQHIMSDDFG